MSKIITKTCLYACAFIMSTVSCFASKALNYNFISFTSSTSNGNYQPVQFNPNPAQPLAHTNFDQATAEYLQAMINADASQGDVLWGGELEFNAMAQLYDICIIVEEVHQDGHVTYTTINQEGKAKTITLYYNNNHYTYYNTDGNLAEVDGDGNCMFAAFLGAQGLDRSLDAITELRHNVVYHMSQDQNIKEKILHSLIGDNRINDEASLADMQRSSNPSQMNPVKKQKRQYHGYSQEDNERLLYMAKNNPCALTKKEYRHLYNMQHAEKIKQQQKQYNQDNAKEIRQRQKQYYQDNAKEIRQQQKQYYQNNAEDKKQQQQQQVNAGKQQAQAKYDEYFQTTSDEPKKNFKAWCEQKLKTIEYPKALQ